ncbi:nitroreductase family protein [Carboxylicivirga marina]|uniref:Nitroreductase family protein n=1 Tax=Carboxylicivirga marina TaxID=2800988 RepID=A0ABS1HH84_9BACT|nr:nitroreductase family protein [Carboxylicivirga marina]MBK3517037.1 nitroreductase family protein [Carboxylicivirga marina]
MQVLSTKEAIESRRSIRQFKPEAINDSIIMELLESARLAPSGCNSQPWRFKIVKDKATKEQLQALAYDQKFVSQAPVVLVVCADVQGYIDGRTSGVQDLADIGVFDNRLTTILNETTHKKSALGFNVLSHSVAFNVAIAIEHIVLRALDFGLGTCWMKLMNEQAIQQLFGWDNNIVPVALLPIGYPAEAPAPRKRVPIEDLIIGSI